MFKKSPTFFRKKTTPAVTALPYAEAGALVGTLCTYADREIPLYPQVGAQSHTVLRCALSIIARDLAVLKIRMDALFEEAYRVLPTTPTAVTRSLLLTCRDSVRDTPAEVLHSTMQILKPCATILVGLEVLAQRHIAVGNIINERLVQLKQKHDWDTLLPPDTPGYLFPDVQNVHLASRYNTLPAPDAPGMYVA